MVALPAAERDEVLLGPVMRVLQKVEFTAGLETAVLKGIARFVMYESFPAGYTVVRQGEPGALFYIILSGQQKFVFVTVFVPKATQLHEVHAAYTAIGNAWVYRNEAGGA